jgi:threonine dehydratase
VSDYLSEHASEIEAAAERIRPYIRRTPTLETDLSPQLLVKPECLQVTGSFKVRGAFNAMLRIKQRQPDVPGVIAVSSGNHAQAVALAAKTLQVPAVILIPADSNPAKIAATRALGAEVITEGVTAENREQMVQDLSTERNLTLVHPFDNWDVIHGQGTAALELLHYFPDVKTIVAPVGGGGLISGTALAAKAHNPAIRIIGVEPEVAADAAASLHSHQRQSLPGPPKTLADGVRTLSIGQRSFEVLVEQALLEDVVTVSEQELEAATLLAWERLKLGVEPTGALPVAAYLTGKLGPTSPSGPTALILSGGNADRAIIARIMSSR